MDVAWKMLNVAPGRRNGSQFSAKFFTTQLDAVGMICALAAPQFFKKESETGKLLMAMEMHMDDLYATGSEDVLHHTLHLKYTVVLKIEHQGVSWQPRTPQTTSLPARRHLGVQGELERLGGREIGLLTRSVHKRRDTHAVRSGGKYI